MDEQLFFQYIPFIVFLAYISYNIIDICFYNKYSTVDNCDNIYYEINGTMYKADDKKIIELKPLECSRNLLNFNNFKENIIYDTDDDDDDDDDGDDLSLIHI